jgi:hypothetical protein
MPHIGRIWEYTACQYVNRMATGKQDVKKQENEQFCSAKGG